MKNIDNLAKLQLLICELKLEKRRVDNDIKNILKNEKRIDFFDAKRLSSARTKLEGQIRDVESRISPDIIA